MEKPINENSPKIIIEDVKLRIYPVKKLMN